MPSLHQNPLFRAGMGEFDVQKLAAKAVHRRSVRKKRRAIRDARKLKLAAEAIEGLDHDTELFGFTKGQFSLIELIQALAKLTGPCHLSISTWTAADHELETIEAMLLRGDLTGTRWLIDFSMARRETAMTARMRKAFGWENIRVAQVHCKFEILQNADWRLVLRSSMNLNMNPRMEDFTIAHDPEIAAFLNGIMDEIFAKQARELADARPYDIIRALEANDA